MDFPWNCPFRLPCLISGGSVGVLKLARGFYQQRRSCSEDSTNGELIRLVYGDPSSSTRTRIFWNASRLESQYGIDDHIYFALTMAFLISFADHFRQWAEHGWVLTPHVHCDDTKLIFTWKACGQQAENDCGHEAQTPPFLRRPKGPARLDSFVTAPRWMESPKHDPWNGSWLYPLVN